MASSAPEFVRPLLRWGRTNRRSFPWRSTTDPFRVLIAEVLLQRSRGKTAAGVFERLFAQWPDAERLARAPLPSISAVIRPLGLTGRAATLKALAAEVTVRGAVPRSVQSLQELPGVGQYAAAATAVVAYGKAVPTVDGVSARVYRRYFGLTSELPPSNDRELWSLVAEVMPKRSVREWNWAVLDLAALICLPKRPRCEECPLQTSCLYPPMRVGGGR